MLDFSHLPSSNPKSVTQTILGTAMNQTTNYVTWCKPRGKSMCNIILIGKGGNGSAGFIGNTNAAGGGGGGSGAQTSLTFPLWAVPDTLYLMLPGSAVTSTFASYVSIAPNSTARNLIAIANGGGNSSAAANGTAGTAGAAGIIATATLMPLGWAWVDTVLVGQVGTAGGTNVTGAAKALPVTGLLCMGGTGGGGLPAAAAAGTNGGLITAAGVFPGEVGGIGGTAATVPPTNGVSGLQPVPGLTYFQGGTGGGSTHGSATGSGLVQSNGGDGAPGCGGGGSGGAWTGSTPGVAGRGGPALCIITCW